MLFELKFSSCCWYFLSESEPYRVFNNKKYGRRSQPTKLGSLDDGIHSDGDLDLAKKRKSSIEKTPNTHKQLVRRSSSRVSIYDYQF